MGWGKTISLEILLKRVKRVISNLNNQPTSDQLKAVLLRAIRHRNDEETSDQTTQKSTKVFKIHSLSSPIVLN